MCGILGIIDRKIAVTEFQQCLETLSHRGPDDEGVWLNRDGRVILGHKRLSILDLSEAGHQPMVTDDGRYAIVFNGEIYNYRDLKKQLDKRGIRFKGHCDTEVLLQYLICYGIEKTLENVDGMFAFGFWDEAEKKLYLVRDHIGEKPLYYGFVNKEFIFSSGLKAIQTHPQFNDSISKEAVQFFFTYKFIPSPSSIYENIYKLEPGHYLRLSEGNSIIKKQYYNYADVALKATLNCENLSESESLDILDEVLTDSIKGRLISDVPVGAFLSGGLDSSLIVSILAKRLNRNVETFTIGFEEKSYDESRYARQIAQYLGINHNEMIFSKRDALDAVLDIYRVYDEPFADVSQLPTYLVSRFARNKVKVVLSGDGGDELFAGYNRYIIADKMTSGIKGKIIKNICRCLFKTGGNRLLSSLLGIYKDVKKQNLKVILANEHLTRLNHLVRSKAVNEIYSSVMMNFDNNNQYFDNVPYFKNIKAELDNVTIQQACMIYDAVYFLSDAIFTKLDRATMSVSLEGRVPLVSRKMIEAAWKIPMKFKVKQGKRKYILYSLLKRYLPEEYVDRPKSGFGVPMPDWLRGELKNWAGDILNSRLCREDEFIDDKIVSKIFNMHLQRQGNWSQSLWTVLMYLNWKGKHHQNIVRNFK